MENSFFCVFLFVVVVVVVVWEKLKFDFFFIYWQWQRHCWQTTEGCGKGWPSYQTLVPSGTDAALEQCNTIAPILQGVGEKTRDSRDVRAQTRSLWSSNSHILLNDCPCQLSSFAAFRDKEFARKEKIFLSYSSSSSSGYWHTNESNLICVPICAFPTVRSEQKGTLQTSQPKVLNNKLSSSPMLIQFNLIYSLSFVRSFVQFGMVNVSQKCCIQFKKLHYRSRRWAAATG